jgi:O-antigen/teichoic acid export membrane protein
MNKIWQMLNSAGVRQSLISVVGNFSATGISAVALIIISRLLGPEKFGEFSVGFSLVLILTKINDMGLSATILKFGASAPTNEEKNEVYSLTLRYKLAITIVLVVAGVLGVNYLADLLNFHNIPILLASFTIGLITVYYEQLLSMSQSVHLFTQAVLVNAIQASVKLSAAIIIWLSSQIGVGLVFAVYMGAPVLPVLLTKKIMPKWFKIDLRIKSGRYQSKIINMAKHSAVSLICAGLIENADVLFVKKYLDTYETGLYSGALRIAMAFALIAYSLGNVLYPRVAKYKYKYDLQPYLKKSLLVVLLALLGAIAFIPFSKIILILTIGSQYLPSLSVLNILVMSSFLAVATIPFIAMFYSYDASWYFSVSGLLQLAVVIIGNVWFVPIYGLEAAAWTRLATRVVLLLFTFMVAIYYYRKLDEVKN